MVIRRWSDQLIELTRQLLKNGDQRFWHLKHIGGGFGVVLNVSDGGGFLIAARATGAVLVFAGIDALIEDGGSSTDRDW